MERIDALLRRIHWSNDIRSLKNDLEVLFKLITRKGYSEDVRLHAWDVVIEKSLIMSVLLTDSLSHTGYLLDTEKEIVLGKIKACFDMSMSDDLSCSSFVELYASSVLIDYERQSIEEYYLKKHIDRSQELDILKQILDIIKETSDTESNTITAIIHFYNCFSPKNVRYALTDYNLPTPEYRIEDLARFMRFLTHEGAFSYLFTVTKTFNIDFKNFGIGKDEIYDALYNAGQDDFLRGALFYKQIIDSETSDPEMALLEWVSTTLRIDTDTAKDFGDGIRFLSLCYMIQINKENARDAVLGKFGNLSKMIQRLDFDMTGILTYIKEYRKTVQSLILYDRDGFLVDFINATRKYNIDKFSSNKLRPQGMNQQLRVGLKPELLVEKLVNNTSEVGVAIYVYLNSFVRGIVSLQMLVNQLLLKYDISSIRREFRTYTFRIYCAFGSNSDIVFVRPIGIKNSKKLYVAEESATKLRENTDLLDKEILAKIISINPNSQVIKFAIWGFTESRLKELNECFDRIIETKEIDGQVQGCADEINLTLIHITDEEHIDMCVKLLDSIAALSSVDDGEKIVKLLEMVSHANYFKHIPERKETARNIKGIAPQMYKQIWNDSRIILESDIDLPVCFHIYQNTIMRRAMTLSKFMKFFVGGRKISYKEFLSSLPSIIGVIQGTNTDSDNHSLLIFMTPNEFSVSNYTKDQQVLRDQFVFALNIDEGKSLRALRKENDIRNGLWVEFFIEDFDGDRTFTVREYRSFIFRKYNQAKDEL